MITLSTTSCAGEPQPRRHFAVHVELDAGIVEVLRNQHIAHALQRLESFAPSRCAMCVSRCMIVAADLDVDGRRHSLVDDGVHQAAGLEDRWRAPAGRCASLRRTRSMYAKLLTLCSFFKLHLHERGVHAPSWWCRWRRDPA